ncbi:Uncharacterized protein DBV15_11946 [Temnothorax longispinosus]|uniref:Uncharacterized protein n=1 Tax=Temnothorax longispinosus TaxID=300112 RepID=A0A4V3S9Z6_9HYME|nr:Uncharacterized protein DBV15_11946 [Temnothorax longispinosus]
MSNADGHCAKIARIGSGQYEYVLTYGINCIVSNSKNYHLKNLNLAKINISEQYIIRKTLYKILEMLKDDQEAFTQVKNIAYETLKFFNRMQQKGEKCDSFLAEIKKLSQTCEFGTMADRVVRDRIILEIKDKVLQERLLRVEDLNLQKQLTKQK